MKINCDQMEMIITAKQLPNEEIIVWERVKKLIERKKMKRMREVLGNVPSHHIYLIDCENIVDR